MEVLLDTNFIVSCLVKKIDFVDELEGLGFKIVVPKEVMQELKDIKLKNTTKRKQKEAIDLAFTLFSQRKVKKTSLGAGFVDSSLIAKGKEGVYIATLDRDIKSKVPNKVVIDSARNSLLIERS